MFPSGSANTRRCMSFVHVPFWICQYAGMLVICPCSLLDPPTRGDACHLSMFPSGSANTRRYMSLLSMFPSGSANTRRCMSFVHVPFWIRKHAGMHVICPCSLLDPPIRGDACHLSMFPSGSANTQGCMSFVHVPFWIRQHVEMHVICPCSLLDPPTRGYACHLSMFPSGSANTRRCMSFAHVPFWIRQYADMHVICPCSLLDPPIRGDACHLSMFPPHCLFLYAVRHVYYDSIACIGGVHSVCIGGCIGPDGPLRNQCILWPVNTRTLAFDVGVNQLRPCPVRKKALWPLTSHERRDRTDRVDKFMYNKSMGKEVASNQQLDLSVPASDGC